MNFVEELNWRGMVHDMMPGTREEFNKDIVTAYIGFDPTSDSLHIGSLVQIMTLVHLQRSGHKPIILIGGATGMVGDPSGKSKERNLLEEETLNYNVTAIQKQLERFLDFDCGKNSAEIVNNYDWFKDYRFLDFLRDIGKHISVNYMMSKDSVKSRLETGISFTEFSYQLVQGYDFYWLWENKNCTVQLGGSDQWGNIVTGTEIIRRSKAGKAFAITTPLIEKSDGGKFGKTEEGNVWLDKTKTSAYKFYQFWINSSDEDSKRYIKIFTLKTESEIDEIIKEHEKNPHLRILQKSIAEEITVRVHGKDALQMAIKSSSILFGKSTTEDLRSLDEETFLSIFEGVPQFKIRSSELNRDVIDLLSDKAKVFASKGEARRMISSNAISINKEKVTEGFKLSQELLLNKRYLLVQKGKKNYFILIVE